MGWLCRLLEEEPQVRYPGDMWYSPEMVSGIRGQYAIENELSDEYVYNAMSKRAPLMLVTPDRNVICLDSRFFRYDMEGTRVKDGYRVYGKPPKITVIPSVQTDDYHGWLTNGILGSDFEEREYD